MIPKKHLKTQQNSSNVVAFPQKTSATPSVDFNGEIVLMVTYQIKGQNKGEDKKAELLFVKTFTGDSASNFLLISEAISGTRNICHRYPGDWLTIEGWLMTKNVVGVTSVFKATIAGESIEELNAHLSSFKNKKIKAC